MRKPSRAFGTERELALAVGRELRGGLDRPGVGSVKLRWEVPAPGCIPDMIMFSKHQQTILYVVSFEFKLKDWRRALVQAFRYRNFGNESYVVLDGASVAAALKNLEHFRLANVGLASIAVGGAIQVWHFPEPAIPFSSRSSRTVALELIRRRLPPDLPFARTVRGGAALSHLRGALSAKADSWEEQI